MMPQIEPEWEAKDIYSNRPFPAFIGSTDFYQTDHIGLRNYESDSTEVSESDDDDDDDDDDGDDDDSDKAHTTGQHTAPKTATNTMDIDRTSSDGSLFSGSDQETSPNKKVSKKADKESKEDRNAGAANLAVFSQTAALNHEQDLFNSSQDSEDLFSESKTTKDEAIVEEKVKSKKTNLKPDLNDDKKHSKSKHLTKAASTLGSGTIFADNSSSEEEKSSKQVLQDSSVMDNYKIAVASNDKSIFDNETSSDDDNLFAALLSHKSKNDSEKSKLMDKTDKKTHVTSKSKYAKKDLLIEDEESKNLSSGDELFSDLVNSTALNKKTADLENSSMSEKNPKKKLAGAVSLFSGLGESDLFSTGIIKQKPESIKASSKYSYIYVTWKAITHRLYVILSMCNSFL